MKHIGKYFEIRKNKINFEDRNFSDTTGVFNEYIKSRFNNNDFLKNIIINYDNNKKIILINSGNKIIANELIIKLSDMSDFFKDRKIKFNKILIR